MQSKHLLMQKGFPLETEENCCSRCWWCLAEGWCQEFTWASQSSFAWLCTEVSRRNFPASLNISSVGIQDLPHAWAAAQNVNSGGRKRLLAELKMKINLEELAPFVEIKGG